MSRLEMKLSQACPGLLGQAWSPWTDSEEQIIMVQSIQLQTSRWLQESLRGAGGAHFLGTAAAQFGVSHTGVIKGPSPDQSGCCSSFLGFRT